MASTAYLYYEAGFLTAQLGPDTESTFSRCSFCSSTGSCLCSSDASLVDSDDPATVSSYRLGGPSADEFDWLEEQGPSRGARASRTFSFAWPSPAFPHDSDSADSNRHRCGSPSRSVDLCGLALPLLTPGSSLRARKRALGRLELVLSRRAFCVPLQRSRAAGTLLRKAVGAGCAELVTLLLASRMDPNEHPKKDRAQGDPDCDTYDPTVAASLVSLAATSSNPEILKALLEAKGCARDIDAFGRTPLFVARTASSCEALMRARADLNVVDSEGFSAVHFAAKAGLEDVLVWHASHASHALLRLRDPGGRTAADYAEQENVSAEIVSHLRVPGPLAFARLAMRGGSEVISAPRAAAWEALATCQPPSGGSGR